MRGKIGSRSLSLMNQSSLMEPRNCHPWMATHIGRGANTGSRMTQPQVKMRAAQFTYGGTTFGSCKIGAVKVSTCSFETGPSSCSSCSVAAAAEPTSQPTATRISVSPLGNPEHAALPLPAQLVSSRGFGVNRPGGLMIVRAGAPTPEEALTSRVRSRSSGRLGYFGC